MNVSYELTKVLDVLAERFGTTVEYLYGVLLKQVYIEAWGNIIGLIAVLSLFIIWRIIAHQVVTKENNGRNYSQQAWYNIDGLSMSFGAIMIIIFIAAPCFIYAAVVRFMNPDYFVLDLIMKMIAGGA